MWYCEALGKGIYKNSESSHFKLTAHLKENFNFRTNNDLTDKKLIFDEPNNNQLDKIVEEAITD